MGNFKGHALPGTFFFGFGVWHLIDIYKRYFRSHFEPQRHPYCNQATITMDRFPVEAIIKIVATVLGFVGELYTGFYHGKFTHVHNGQHMTMYSFFFLNGLVDLMVFFKVQALPLKIDYISAAFAFSIEGLLFIWHLHGRPPMDVQVHTFLFYTISMAVVGILLEMLYPYDVRPALLRSVAIITQGIWFWAAGQILYPLVGDNWDFDSHEQMLVVTMLFTWIVGFVVVMTFAIGVAVYSSLRTSYGKDASGKNNLTNGDYKRLGEVESNVKMDLYLEDDSTDEDGRSFKK